MISNHHDQGALHDAISLPLGHDVANARSAAKTASGRASRLATQVSGMAPTVTGLSRFAEVCTVPLTGPGGAKSFWIPCSGTRPGS